MPRRETRQQASPAANSPTTSSGRKVNRSCTECTRRKVKCDGHQPCESCVYYRVDEGCSYRQRSKRHAVSRSTYDKAAEQLHAQAAILNTLFPNISLSELTSKNHDELLDILGGSSIISCQHPPLPHLHNPPARPAAAGDLSTVPDVEGGAFPGTSGADDSAPMSENGEPIAERQWDESLDQSVNVASDDINAMGLATDQRAHSYLGMTSMSTVMKAIFRLCPAAKEHAAECARAWAAAPVRAQPSFLIVGRDLVTDRLREQRCIDFYFEHLHAVTPLLDEEDFRQQYASGTRHDGSWMGLLNMVLAMGSIASGSDSLHEHYHHQARTFTSLDSLGSGNLEGLQALCLLGGYYLHYRNSPNMAYGIMGAAHRVAIALGLHREPRRSPIFTDAVEANSYRRRLETRRRAWWSLICLDTWACMTQGRPTCGRWDSSTMDTVLPQPLHPDDYAGISLRASSQFCVIHDRIQHRFAQFGRPTTREILELESEVQAWYDSLPPHVKQVENSPPRYQIAREYMRTRYLNSRTILSRSLMLYVAYDCKKKSVKPSPEQQKMIETACRVASDAVDEITLYWTPNRIHVWNSAWYLFQTCAIPLLGMAIEKNMPHSASAQTLSYCQTSLSKALETFSEMRSWMRASDRTPDIVAALYETLAKSDAPTRTPSTTDGSIDLFGWNDDHLTGIDWSLFLGEDVTQGMFPIA